MEINWDSLIGFGIILAILLAIVARLSGQSILDLLRNIRDFFLETKEEVVERGEQTIIFD